MSFSRSPRQLLPWKQFMGGIHTSFGLLFEKLGAKADGKALCTQYDWIGIYKSAIVIMVFFFPPYASVLAFDPFVHSSPWTGTSSSSSYILQRGQKERKRSSSSQHTGHQKQFTRKGAVLLSIYSQQTIPKILPRGIYHFN